MSKWVKFIAERHERFLPLLNRSDEVFYGLMLYLETNYMFEYGAVLCGLVFRF